MVPVALQNLPTMTVAPGTVLFEEKQACPGMPIIDEGVVKVYKTFPNGRELLMYYLDPGQSCTASVACLFGTPLYNARAIAQTTVKMRLVPPDLFHASLADPEFQRFAFRWPWAIVLGHRQLNESYSVFEGTAAVPVSQLGPTRLISGADADLPLTGRHEPISSYDPVAVVHRYQVVTTDHVVDVWATQPPEITEVPIPEEPGSGSPSPAPTPRLRRA